MAKKQIINVSFEELKKKKIADVLKLYKTQGINPQSYKKLLGDRK